MAGLRAGPVKRAQQERIRVQPAISSHDNVVDAIVWEEEDMEATITVTKKYYAVTSVRRGSGPLTAVCHTVNTKGTHLRRGLPEATGVYTSMGFGSFP